jgi:UDP-GlcNAc:undecaprenyl-phosphate GlcNAc-1-phosphate transferase
VRTLALSFVGRKSARAAKQSAVRLQGSLDWAELWAELTEAAQPMNLRTVCLDVNAPALHEGYHARWDRGVNEAEGEVVWRADIPLTAGKQVIARLEVVGYQDDEPVWLKIQTLSQMVQTFETAADQLVSGAWVRGTKALWREEVHAS